MRIFICISLLVVISACSKPASNDHAEHNAPQSSNTSNNAAPMQDHSTMDHNSMDHSAMQSSPGAASAPYDLQFIDTMTVHHQGAVEMAKLVDSRAQHQELKDLAADIIDAQEREIAKMSEWRNGWFDGKPKAINMDLPGMSEGMSGMDMKKLEQLKGNDFDLEFTRQMIQHHEGAITMAKDLMKKSSRPELKELGEDILTSQQKEVEEMRQWQKAWQRPTP